jgi:hypothetical protein
MRCGVVVEEEGNKFFVGRRFVYFGEAELCEIWQEPLSSATLPPFNQTKRELSGARGLFLRRRFIVPRLGNKKSKLL